MTTLENLIDYQRVFVKVEWPESQIVEEQWWFKEQGFFTGDGNSGIVMVPVVEYIKWKNDEDMTYVYSSLQEAVEDFDIMLGRISDDMGFEGSSEEEIPEDVVVSMLEEASDYFESKSGFRTPELIPYFN